MMMMVINTKSNPPRMEDVPRPGIVRAGVCVCVYINQQTGRRTDKVHNSSKGAMKVECGKESNQSNRIKRRVNISIQISQMCSLYFTSNELTQANLVEWYNTNNSNRLDSRRVCTTRALGYIFNLAEKKKKETKTKSSYDSPNHNINNKLYTSLIHSNEHNWALTVTSVFNLFTIRHRSIAIVCMLIIAEAIWKPNQSNKNKDRKWKTTKDKCVRACIRKWGWGGCGALSDFALPKAYVLCGKDTKWEEKVEESQSSRRHSHTHTHTLHTRNS